MHPFLFSLLSAAIQDKTMDTPKAFEWVWHNDLLHKPKCYKTFGQVFSCDYSFLGNWWLCVDQDEDSLQEYPFNPDVPQSSIFFAIH